MLLILLTLTLMISFINETLKVNAVNDKRITLLTQANVIANQVSLNFYGLNKEGTRDYLENLIKRYSLDIGSRILVIDKQGYVQLDSYDSFEGQNLNRIEEVRVALEGRNSSNLYNTIDLEKIMYVAVPITARKEVLGSILVSSSAKAIFDSIQLTIQKVMALSMLGIGITAIVSFIFADIISGPIERMTEVVRAITRGQHDRRVNVRGSDELANLGNAFNLMLTKLDQLDERRKQFVSNASHELRTPMASMKIISESLLAQDQWDEAVYREFLADIDTEITRLNQLIDSLLYLVDVDKKELQLDFHITYLNYLMENVVRQLTPLAEKKDISISFTAQEHVQIEIDKGKIQQCLINILGNAIKYTPDGGRVNISMYRLRGQVVVRIEDSGIGIPEDEIPHIFDRFHRVDKARARATGGSGLGLSIAQQIVHLHQGQIYAESEVGVGTTMYVVLPLHLDV